MGNGVGTVDPCWPPHRRRPPSIGFGLLRSQGSGASSTSHRPRAFGIVVCFQRGPSRNAASTPPARPPMWPLQGTKTSREV